MKTQSFGFCDKECRECYREDRINGVEHKYVMFEGVEISRQESNSIFGQCRFCDKDLSN